MDKMTAVIREIVREEIKKMGTEGMDARMKEEKENVEFIERRRPARKSEREGVKWSSFETDLLADAFFDFCLDRSLKTGRSYKSISCKVRRMMYEGQIKTWESDEQKYQERRKS
jgi:hypothetical protein